MLDIGHGTLDTGRRTLLDIERRTLLDILLWRGTLYTGRRRRLDIERRKLLDIERRKLLYIGRRTLLDILNIGHRRLLNVGFSYELWSHPAFYRYIKLPLLVLVYHLSFKLRLFNVALKREHKIPCALPTLLGNTGEMLCFITRI